jgi:tetratricopeptide (TPR) repeat protein
MMRAAVLLALAVALLGCDSGAARAQDPAAGARPAGSRTAAPGDSLSARVARGETAWNRGDRDAALAEFRPVYEAFARSGSRLSAPQLIAAGTAARYLGRQDHRRFRDALRAYDAAAEADPANVEALVLAGELFLEKYNSGDAQDAFAAALRIAPRHPRALLGAARRLQFDGQPGALEQATLSLEADPRFADAHVFVASLHLDDERYGEARAAVDRALAIDSTSLDALTMLAAIHHMQGETAEAASAERRVLARNPRHAELYEKLSELSARHRLYADAVTFARKGVAVDSSAWGAWGLLGINELRTGSPGPAREHLETSFRGDPYNVWIKNTLDLLDTHGQYVSSETDRFRFLLERGEAGLLAPYFAELSEEAYAKLAQRYGHRPAAPITMDVYRRHADFSVRTVGLTGMGALGVSFGRVLAMDSPAARERGSFNWGSTLWHEIAHTFTLGVTDHRIPRWLSEGLSVLEERRARSGWGAQGGLDFLIAMKQGRLLPVSRLTEGFVRPTYPAQVGHAYYQASLVCELIERDWGWLAMGALLAEYRKGRETPEALQAALGVSEAEFDRRFEAYLRERFARPLAALDPASAGDAGAPSDAVARATAASGDLLAQLAAGSALVEAGRGAEAVPFLERAKAIYPEYAGPNSPYRLLAQVFRPTDPRRAAAELARHTALAETDFEANVELATLLEQLGDSAGAAAALERAVWIHPYDPAVHERLATLYGRLGQRARAVRERAAVLALDPVDRSEALYQLARAQLAAGDVATARRSVLSALEIAPGFERAQSLLLEIRRGTGGGAR